MEVKTFKGQARPKTEKKPVSKWMQALKKKKNRSTTKTKK